MAKKRPQSSSSGSTFSSAQEAFNLLDSVISKAKAKGATDVEARIGQSVGMSTTVREGKVEKLSSPNAVSLSVAAHIGDRHATASIGTLKPEHIETMIDSVILSAKLASENPYARVADQSEIATSYPQLDIFDPSVPTIEDLKDRAMAAEDAALQAADIKMSNGASAGWGINEGFTAISNGFQGHFKKTTSGTSAMVIAERNGEMVSDGEGDSAVYQSDLIRPELIGEQAALNATNMLDARSVQSQIAPVIFDRDLGRSILSAFANAVAGPAIARQASFLQNKMGQQIFPEDVTIRDNPFIPRGLGSRPFDTEGMPSGPLTLVENGVLKSWIMDLASARELGLQSTGHGNGVTNLYIEAGDISLEDMMSDIKQGLYVTGLMGGGANVMTNQYSTSAQGFWIENGKIQYPVKGLTLGSNLHDMFLSMRVADDLNVLRSAAATPSLRFEGMTIGGK